MSTTGLLLMFVGFSFLASAGFDYLRFRVEKLERAVKELKQETAQHEMDLDDLAYRQEPSL